MHSLVRLRRGWLLALVAWAWAGPTLAQTPQTKWYLAEGATGTFFEEEILIGNPSAVDADVKVTYLQPGGGEPIVHAFKVKASSRYTERVNSVAGLASVQAVSAVVESLNGVGIVVERSMYWSNGTRRGGHNSQAVAAPAERWFLAEGSTGGFDTFVLIANSDPVNAADVDVTFLTPEGTTVAYPRIGMPPSSRTNIWVNQEMPALANKAFSTVVESKNGTPVFVERAMYFGAGWEGGHESTAITASNTSWFFGEGFTGGSPALSFDTFLLLSNPGTTWATAKVTFLLENAAPIEKTYPLRPTSRENVWVDMIPGLEAAPFSIRVESDKPIVAERAMYWGPTGAWLDGHNTPGVTSSALKWAFAEGAEDGLDDSGLFYDSYFLLANPSSNNLTVRATFVREDGTGVVKLLDVPKQSRFTYATSLIPELSNQRFAAFFESTNDVPFVAERAMYWGEGYFGGHASTGTPWDGTVATPPTPPPPLASSILPASGPTTGGTAVTITGTNFRAGSTVTFGGAPATNVVVLNSTTITATTPAGVPGTVDVVITAGAAATSLAGGFAYVLIAPTVVDVQPATGPTTGGTKVTLTGVNLSGVTGVSVGGVAATAVTVIDDNTVTAVTAPRGAGLVDVVVTTSTGHVANDPSAFTFYAATAVDNVLAFGDSITYGTTSRLVYDANGTFAFIDKTLRAALPYPTGLFNRLGAGYPSQAFVVQNSGIPGECASYLGCSPLTPTAGVTRLPGSLNGSQDLVVILEGVNDLNQSSPPDYDRIKRNLRQMVQAAKLSGKKVFLGTLTPVKPGEDLVLSGCTDDATCYRVQPSYVSTMNARIRDLASEESVILINFEGALSASDLSPDGLHPNQAGYDKMAQRVFDSIKANYETVPPIVP